MNKQNVEKLVEGIIEIEKEAALKKIDSQSGKGTQFTRAKADADAVNGILNLVESIDEEKKDTENED